MRAWQLSLRLLRRDWRSGELYLLAAALVLTVAAITAVGFFTDRIQHAMERQGGELIAADLVIDASGPIPASFTEEAQAHGLEVAETLSFRSVVLRGDESQLVQVKAVSDGYPLRGELRLRGAPLTEASASAEPIADSQSPSPISLSEDTQDTQSLPTNGNDAERVVNGAPPADQAWVESRLLHVLGSQLGDRIQLGQRTFELAALISNEPDRGGNFFQIAPRVMISLDQIAATGLITEASRARYRLLLAGDLEIIEDYARWAEPLLPANASLIDARDARPEFATAVDRASRFLHLAALSTLLVAGAAIALASRRLVERQTDAVAVMRCLGAPRHLLTRIFVLRLLALGLVASLIGSLIGWIGQHALSLLLSDWFGTALPSASLEPVAVGIVTGMVALAGFALPPLLQLSRVTPLRVLRRDLGAPSVSVALAVGAATAALVLLVLWQAGDPGLAWKLLAGVAGAVLALLAVGGLLVLLARLAASRSRGIWRLGLAGLARRPLAAVLQIVGFGLGILALLMLAVVRLDLLNSWQQTLPSEAPNNFLINIQPAEVTPLEAFFAEREIRDSGIYPMIRARLTEIGDAPVQPEDFADPRAQRLAEREFNLSYASALQPDNEIIAGQWWQGADAAPQFSVEEGIAETLGISLGDELRYWVAGQEVSAPVTSLRRVQWDSFNVNFFVIGTPSLLDAVPATYITSFYLPQDREDLIPELLRQFPSLTLIDVGALLEQVRGIIDQGIRAVEYVFLFTLVAGLLVMYAGIQASLAVRRSEHGVLRTLGASRATLMLGLLVEFTTTGLLAGLTASLFAELTGWLLAEEILGLPFAFNPWLWFFGVFGSGLLIGLAGTLGTYGALVRPPLKALRAGS